MADNVVLLSVPNLRATDPARMPRLQELTAAGDRAELVASFPAVTCAVQANMTTGVPPSEHGVVGNGFFWRDESRIEMWTAFNDVVMAPQIWDRLHEHDPGISSAAWFPMLSKECGADFICAPAPKHNDDGTESLWCYTRPEPLYESLLAELGHFPLQHFWGPLASIPSTAWIVDSAVVVAERYTPNLFYIYLPHLDYAAQKTGPDSDAALQAVVELDEQIGRLAAGFKAAYGPQRLLWLVASEYAIVPVARVGFPNRILREAGLLEVSVENGREFLDLPRSAAWAMADHQFAHIFVRDRNERVIQQVAERFGNLPEIAEVLVGDQRDRYKLTHERTGDVVLIAEPDAWFAYYWWLDDSRAPAFATTVDIHQKPGYDPVELYWDPALGGVPLDARRVHGSHGAPPRLASQRGVLLSSERGAFVEQSVADTDVAQIVLRQFGV